MFQAEFRTFDQVLVHNHKSQDEATAHAMPFADRWILADAIIECCLNHHLRPCFKRKLKGTLVLHLCALGHPELLKNATHPFLDILVESPIDPPDLVKVQSWHPAEFSSQTEDQAFYQAIAGKSRHSSDSNCETHD
jgi:hypothetical protein